MEKLPTWPARRIDDLLPHNWLLTTKNSD